MNNFRGACAVEIRKASASRPLWVTSGVFVLGLALLGSGLVIAVSTGNDQVMDRLGSAADLEGWPLLLTIVTQIAAAGGMLAFGFALSWSFGREFTDGTIPALLASPTARSVVVLAKLLTHLLWVCAVAVVSVGALFLVGILLGLGPVNGDVLADFTRLALLLVLSGAVVVPTSLVATLGRGPLPGIGAAIALIVVSQVAAIVQPATAAWLPFAAPAIWALFPEVVGVVQLGLVIATSAVFCGLTVHAWNRLELDRGV
ncbi:ABC transporter permease [Actinoalloteichus spitiensis]|uniref:ABC transporter permease n=1 Tax=Actinoalloteichus spitiensis TaxID=252394 RepID=UPI0002EAA9B3|nr:ABC transporter permease [Actinoalloteichus spitiensis]